MINSKYCRNFYRLCCCRCKSSCCTKTQILCCRRHRSRDSIYLDSSHLTCGFAQGSLQPPDGCCRCCLALQAPKTWPPKGCSPSTSKRPPPRCRCLRSRSNEGFFLPCLPKLTLWWQWCLLWPDVLLLHGSSPQPRSSSSSRRPRGSNMFRSPPSRRRRLPRICPRCRVSLNSA